MINQVRMVRVSSHPDHGTFGVWLLNNQPMAVTLEPYHRENERNISCIPSGQYIMERVNSPTYGDTFEVTNVQGRSKILIHWGNLDDNTEGCILLGESLGLLNGDWAVLSSRIAFTEFMTSIGDAKEIYLTIGEAY